MLVYTCALRHHFPPGALASFPYTDNLQDLRLLLQHVEDSETLVILQSRKVLTRPWVILELYTALTHDVPIVALNIQNSYRYDYSQALEFMRQAGALSMRIISLHPSSEVLTISFE